jgi:hypothetical protein
LAPELPLGFDPSATSRAIRLPKPKTGIPLGSLPSAWA